LGRLAFTLAIAGCASLAGVWGFRRVFALPTTAAPTPNLLSDAPPPGRAELSGQFDAKVHPFLGTYCVECHSGDTPSADLDLDAANLGAMTARSDKVRKMIARLSKGQMPPTTDKQTKQPSAAERQAAIAWLKGFASEEIQAHAGDPGVVLAHRLSNAEFNYTIRDLTGVDIQPAKEFPVDPANQAGFDNSGESLMMDPELLKKYLEAAREVSEYMVFQSDGLAFAPHPAMVDTDRDRYAVNRIIDFYKEQPTDLAAYLVAAWHYSQNKTATTPEAVAAQEKVSPKYLRTVYSVLTDGKQRVGPGAALAAWWRAMKDAGGPEGEKKLAASMADWVHALRAATRPTFPNLTIQGMDIGSQPLVIWKTRQIEATRFSYVPGSGLKLQAGLYLDGTPGGPAMKVPAAEASKAEYEKAFGEFAKVFPDEYVITERAPVYLNPNSGEGRLKGHLLSAGLHSQSGYFQDDQPLRDLILNDQDKKVLARLWTDLNLVTNAPLRQFQSMIWFERTDSHYMTNPDFSFVRAEDGDLGDEPKFSQLRTVFLKDLNPRASAQARQGVVEYFDYMDKLFKTTASDRALAEGRQLDSLAQLTARAYRRPLTAAEKQDLLAFYHTLRKDEGLDHEEAVRDTFVSILMSPYFCYRYVSPPPGKDAQGLGDYELASRLSYFLWSSMPDDELLAHAAKGDLHHPDVLLAQAHRMLKDDRVVQLATEFGGNWLDFRQFETFNGVDRERFPTFDNARRESMYQEPIHFLTHLMRDNAPVLDAIYGDYTFVDAALASHYGMKVDVKGTDWVRVDDAGKYERGGMLPMAVFLTKNAPGLRTSPVKRGYWVVKRVLGEEIPAPPPNVPALPPDESKMELTLPQALARHRADPNCATCHVHFDAMGLVFEGYGPTGQVRKTDMAGKPVEETAVFPDGSDGSGLEGLKKYIKQQREGDFLDNLSRELLAYALGRTLMLSDEPLVTQMRENLERNKFQFSALVDTIISSPQFLNKRKAQAASKG
jgi:mono/diheme cytochrome c family protein